MSLLEAHGVGRRATHGNHWILSDVHVTVNGGCRVAVVGPTGSGKTLLMRSLARLDPIDAGSILWRGSALRGDAIPRFRRQAIFLHQRPAMFEGTVEENLRLPFTLNVHRKEHRQFSREAVLALLERVDRGEEFLGRSARDLSGGEAQIVALVRAIQLQPALLFLDEPTASLDEASSLMIEQLVHEWFEASSKERALVWVSHDKEQVARVAVRILVMENGRLLRATDK